MFTAGGAMFGYCAIGSAVIDSAPATMMTMAITQAKTGRSMKKRDIDTSAFRLLSAASKAVAATGRT